MTCNKCRAYNENKDAEFCGRCGAKLEPPRRIKTAWIKWVGIGVAAWFVWGILIAPFFSSSQPQPSPSSNSLADVSNSVKPATTAKHKAVVPPTSVSSPSPAVATAPPPTCANVISAADGAGGIYLDSAEPCVAFVLNAGQSSPWINVPFGASVSIADDGGQPLRAYIDGGSEAWTMDTAKTVSPDGSFGFTGETDNTKVTVAVNPQTK